MKEPSEHGYPWGFQLCRFSERAVNAVLGGERSERGPEDVLKVAMTERPPGAGMHQTLTLDSTQQGPDRFFGT